MAGVADPGHPTPWAFPLSHAQARLWFIDQVTSDPAVYHLHAALSLSGPLNVAALQEAFRRVQERHESLRTRFGWVDGEPRQIVSAEPLAELAQLGTEDGPETVATALAEAELERPFDLATGPLVRASLLRVGPERHLLVLVAHHIVADGHSLAVILWELRSLYRSACLGGTPDLPDLPLQYADYGEWQRQTLQGPGLDRLLAYWTRRLDGAPPSMELPLDRCRPAVPSHRGVRASLTLPPDLVTGLKGLARRHGATLYMVLLAGFQICLARTARTADIVVGSPVSGRLRAELEPLVGLFVNLLVLRTDLGGDPTVEEALRRVRATVLGALEHQDLPFERLVEAVNPPRSRGQAPLFQVLFSFQQDPPGVGPFHGLTEVPLRLGGRRAMFDLDLTLADHGQGLAADLDASCDLFEPDFAPRMLERFDRVLRGMVADSGQRISRIPLLSAAERHRILVDWNATARPIPDQPLQTLFEAQAARNPDAVAVIHRDRRFSYRDLNRCANRVALGLIERGAGPDAAVAVLMERSPAFIVAILGILKSGAAYVPLDPGQPLEPLAFRLEDSGCVLILTEGPLQVRLPEGGPPALRVDLDVLAASAEAPDDPAPRSTSADLACILYTSGSTGRPKGVEVLHRGIVRLLFGVDYVQLGPGTRTLLASPLDFDAATFELWAPLLHGGTCVLYPEARLAPDVLRAVVDRNAVNTLWLTAALFNAVIQESPSCLRGVAQLLVGGEALSVPHLRRAAELLPGTRICNGYGPTEATTFSCCHPVPDDLPEGLRSIPIGRPIGNSTAYILDDHGEPLPVGVAGELLVGGLGVARGYRNRPDLTAEAFITDPFDIRPGGRLYRTGDLARYLADGRIEFMGRRDRQVKLRGIRIEPGEVEAAIGSWPGLGRCAVDLRTDGPAGPRLVAFLEVPRHRAPAFDTRGLVEALRRSLPPYMVPEAFAVVDRLPMRNGKLDRQRLESIPLGQPGRARKPGPADPTEALLVQLWEDLLGVAPVGVLDDFFDIGGHSLLAFTLLARIEQVFGRRIPVGALYTHATVRALAGAVVAALPGTEEAPIVEVQAGHGGRPFFYLHGDFNGGGFYCRNLARHLDPGQPFLAIHPFGLAGQPPPRPVEDMAAEHLRRIRTIQPVGPYLLGGHCNGALEAYEIAQQLRAAGQEVALLVLIDPPEPSLEPRPPRAPLASDPDGRPARLGPRDLNRRFQQVMRDYRPVPYDRPVRLLRSGPATPAPPGGGWARLVVDLQGYRIGRSHLSAITRDAAGIGARIQHCLDEVQGTGPGARQVRP